VPNIADSLPALYRSLLPELFARPIHQETKSDCDNCPMISQDCSRSLAKLPLGGYHANTKCCSYQPGHVNYLVGGLLAEGKMPEGAARMRERIKRKLGEPYGVSSPPDLRAKYESMESGNIKVNEHLRCEFYNNSGAGSCGIWFYRDAVCSMFFCKHEHGADGKDFWAKAKEYLEFAEDQLSRYAAYRIDPDLYYRAEARLQDEELEQTYEEMWGDFVGDEENFYRKCFEIVSALNVNEFQRIMGLEGMILLDELEQCFRKLGPMQKSHALILSKQTHTMELDASTVAVSGHSNADYLTLSRREWDALKSLSLKESRKAALARIKSQFSVDFSAERIEQLQRFRILIGH